VELVLLDIVTLGPVNSFGGCKFKEFIVLFGVERFLSRVLLLDIGAILSLFEFIPPLLAGETTDPCKTRRDSGCLDLEARTIIRFQ
jgi:hypothetical protein